MPANRKPEASYDQRPAGLVCVGFLPPVQKSHIGIPHRARSGVTCPIGLERTGAFLV